MADDSACNGDWDNVARENTVTGHTTMQSIAPNIHLSILSFQLICNSFIPFFSFLQHINWEKFNTIFNSTIINSWGIAGLMRTGSWSIYMYSVTRPQPTGELRAKHTTARHTTARHETCLGETCLGVPEPLLHKHPVTCHKYPVTCHKHPVTIAPNILTSILSLQHTCKLIHSFFSFLQHINWEKFNTIFNSTIINYWGIADELRPGLLSIQILTQNYVPTVAQRSSLWPRTPPYPLTTENYTAFNRIQSHDTAFNRIQSHSIARHTAIHPTQHSYIHSLISTHMQTHSFLFLLLTTHQMREIHHNIHIEESLMNWGTAYYPFQMLHSVSRHAAFSHTTCCIQSHDMLHSVTRHRKTRHTTRCIQSHDTRHVAFSHTTHDPLHSVTRHTTSQHTTHTNSHSFSITFTKNWFLFYFTSILSVLTNDFKYDRLYLFHLLRRIQCIQSQTHSLPIRVLCKACLQNLLRNIPLRRWRLRSKVHVLQHRLHTFSHSQTRSHKDLPRRPIRTTPGGCSIRSRTCHASTRASRSRTWPTRSQHWFAITRCSRTNKNS